VDKEEVETAPVFDKDTPWPYFSDTLWGKSIYDYAPLDFVRIDDSERLSNRSSGSTAPCHARFHRTNNFRA
jgi:hypothetical protein